MKNKQISVEEFCYNNKNPFIRNYFNGLLIKAVRISKYWEFDYPLILDFGCNCRQLKKILQGFMFKYNTNFFKYIGYDIDKKYSDIKDYAKIKPDFIFCINVLEHLTNNEIINTLRNFRKMNRNTKLITAIPKMNFLSNLLNNNFDPVNENKKYEIHKSHFSQIQVILNKMCNLIDERNYWLIQKVQIWRFKK